MADTRNDVIIPQGSWVNLYTLSGVSVGTAVTVINKGSNAFFVSVQSASPAAVTSGSPKGIPVYPSGQFGSNVSIATSASGLWAYCELNSGTIALVQD